MNYQISYPVENRDPNVQSIVVRNGIAWDRIGNELAEGLRRSATGAVEVKLVTAP